jgi:hypothetical protein
VPSLTWFARVDMLLCSSIQDCRGDKGWLLGVWVWWVQYERAEELRREQQMQNPLEPLLIRLLREYRCGAGRRGIR